MIRDCTLSASVPCGSDRDRSVDGSEQRVLRVVGCCVGAFLVGGCEGLRGGGAASHFGADVFPAGSVVVQLPGIVFVVAHAQPSSSAGVLSSRRRRRART